MQRLLVLTWPLAVLALVWLAATGAAVTLCGSSSGLPAPDVPTLMVSTNSPADVGWIVKPNCEFEIIYSIRRIREAISVLLIESRGIERVASVPTDLIEINLINNPLSRGADFSTATKTRDLLLQKFSPALMDNLILPKALETLLLWYTAITSIDKVAFPEGLKTLSIVESTLRSIDTVVFPAKLLNLALVDSTLRSVDNAKFPERLQTLELTAPLASVDNVKFPPFLIDLFLRTPSITSLSGANFPSTLKYLWLETKYRRLDFVIPSKLDFLRVENSPIPILERVSFPNAITTIALTSCNTTVVRGVAWPSSLQKLSIGPVSISNFEIRQSDVQLFESLSSSSAMNLSRSVCTDPTGNLTVINKIFKWKVCVISDERFDTLYGVQPTVLPASSSPTDESASGQDDDSLEEVPKVSQPVEASGSGSMDLVDDDTIAFPGLSKTTRRPSTRKPSFDSSSLPVEGLDSSDEGFANNSSRPPRRANSTRTKPSTKSKVPGSDDEIVKVVEVRTLLAKTLVVATIVAGVLLALVILCFGVRRLIVASRSHEKSNDIYRSLDTPTITASSSSDHATKSSVVGAGAICNDLLLRPFRIKQSDVVLKKMVSRVGSYELINGIYKGQDVAIKRVSPAFSSDEHIMASFDEEIRMCAGLDHPKIVAFVGITWSHPRDLSAIVEFMAGGDLETLLYSHQEPPIARDWSAPWTTSQIKSKLSIALDVAEAVVYLHASKTPITLRDLRARNVLLDGEGNAKLDAFAINRSTPGDETMKEGVESVAWMAPEVLMGEAFTEKTDVYAFGVLLVELDRCRHPFQREATQDSDSNEDAVAQKSIQIAVQICAGELRPTVSLNCPERIAFLADKCLSFDEEKRPCARDIVAELCAIRDHGEQTLQ